MEQAKGQTQRWQPLLPNLRSVNEAARCSGQTRFTALLDHVDVAALERAFRRQRRTASPGVDRVLPDTALNLQLPNRSPVSHLLGENQSASHFVF